MKLLLVMATDDSYETVSRFLKPLGFEMIRYRHVLKAMDNMDEIDPQAIIISAKDFPRHWKTMVQFVRSERSPQECPVILLKGGNFNEDDGAKAAHVGINALVTETLSDTAETEKLQSILALFIDVEDKRKDRRYRSGRSNRFGFVFNNPPDEKLITGEVSTLSVSGLSFTPDQDVLAAKIKIDDAIPSCSLRAGDRIFSPSCIVRGAGKTISMEFVSFPEDEQDALKTYLEEEPVRELKAAVAKTW
ncbi:MAG: PilZ domain-containing protein [Treponema sp.]|jgi:hypothetical protein|nr:PilZ domain-containing protein [Treponema sp.]